ncbi:MAG: hypothetical protein KDD69_17890, partial [Bdellovibrionales bacterium]|nr:hypothetical protein [Bdellovibrionales bacterium]
GVTIDSLSAGASDYVTKPSNVGSVGAGRQAMREAMIPKIKALVAKPTRSAAQAQALPPQPSGATPGSAGLLSLAERAQKAKPATRKTPRSRIDVVAIGVSTGGPNALADLLPRLPNTLPVPVLIVQHMPPVFTRMLAERLDAKCALRVVEAQEGDEALPGTAYIAPGNYHMVANREGTSLRLHLNQQPPENSCRPAVDVLFRSLVESHGAHTLAVVLTGMGKDGLRGCELLAETGAQIVVQDEPTSVVWGMPGYVAEAELAEEILPLDAIAGSIITRLKHDSRGLLHGAS